MKKNDLIDLKKTELKSLLETVKKFKGEIRSLVLDKNMSKLKNLKVIKNKRRDLAQTLTIIRQKQLLEELEVKNV